MASPLREESDQLPWQRRQAGDRTLLMSGEVVMDTGVAEDVATAGEGGGAITSFPTQRTQGGVRGHRDTSWVTLHTKIIIDDI